MNRRSFLQVGAFGAALPLGNSVQGSGGRASVPAQPGMGKKELLPAVPSLQDLASDRMVHRYRDPFNPPEANNEWGRVKAVKSVSGITSVIFPPFYCCGVPEMPFSPGYLTTCELFLNGRILVSYPPPDDQISYRWYPHRMVREAVVQGLQFRTQTFLPSRQRAVVQSISVKNQSRQRRQISLGFDLRAGITVKRAPWFWTPGAEADNRVVPDPERGCVIFEAQHSPAISVQGVSPRPNRIEHGRMLVYELSLNPGETRTFHYVNVIGGDKNDVLGAYERLQADPEEALKKNEADFSHLVRAAFTPGNSEFSGHLPQLVTRDPALWKLYYGGFNNLLVNRVDSPDSILGRIYLVVPRAAPTASYVWDAMLTSLSLALLDPQALRRMLENWLSQDVRFTATDYLTGRGVGPWYAVNDMGMLRCAHDYLRVTGDFAWLDKKLDGKPTLEHLADHALRWKSLDTNGHGLGDYGKLDNLLEVVSTYTHEVTAVNAGNVYGMRLAASLVERRGDSARAAQLRAEAKELAARINRLLYVDGKGWWRCGQPDGNFNEVRHCYDLLTVLDMMFEDLSEKQKKEISHFFWNELYTPLWMHALSASDADAAWNTRADHSWLGAYSGWPPMTAKGLYKIDSSPRVAAWLRGLARAANQGPFGQAHVVETILPPENGGAYKSPVDMPYGNDWCECCAGCYTDLVIDSIFGANLTLFAGLQVQSRLTDFDSAARLLNVSYQGKSYTVTGSGAQPDH